MFPSWEDLRNLQVVITNAKLCVQACLAVAKPMYGPLVGAVHIHQCKIMLVDHSLAIARLKEGKHI